LLVVACQQFADHTANTVVEGRLVPWQILVIDVATDNSCMCCSQNPNHKCAYAHIWGFECWI
jgi:hypothetical protein